MCEQIDLFLQFGSAILILQQQILNSLPALTRNPSTVHTHVTAATPSAHINEKVARAAATCVPRCVRALTAVRWGKVVELRAGRLGQTKRRAEMMSTIATATKSRPDPQR